jgi:hypothetical protein
MKQDSVLLLLLINKGNNISNQDRISINKILGSNHLIVNINLDNNNIDSEMIKMRFSNLMNLGNEGILGGEVLEGEEDLEGIDEMISWIIKQ